MQAVEHLEALVRPGIDATYLALDRLTLPPGREAVLDPAMERAVVVLSGKASVTVDGAQLATVSRHGDVFDGPGDCVYVPAGAEAQLRADAPTGALLAVASARPADDAAREPRVIRAAEDRAVVVGEGSWRRTVRTMLGPQDDASRLILGETINDAGAWSSFPSHRHDRVATDEVRLEEVYSYHLKPANGFAVQITYDPDTGDERARIVRDGDSAVIASGFHPVVVIPGHQLYYLWAMAGEERTLRPHLDPRYSWIQGS